MSGEIEREAASVDLERSSTTASTSANPPQGDSVNARARVFLKRILDVLSAPISAFYALFLQLVWGVGISDLSPDCCRLHPYLWVNVKTNSLLTVVSRVGLLFLIVTPCLLASKSATLSDFHLWKWFMLGALIFLGYPYLYFLLSIFVILAKAAVHPTNNVIYAMCGLLSSVTALLHGTFLLTLWMLYYPHNPHHNKYVVCTLVAWVVGAFLCSLKSAVLMGWTVNTVFERFRDRILIAAFQLFFLMHVLDCICENENYGLLIPWKDDTMKFNPQGSLAPSPSKKLEITYDLARNRKRDDIHSYILDRVVSLDQMKELVRRLVALAKSTKGKEKHPICDNNQTRYDIASIEDEYEKTLFIAELKAEYPSIPFENDSFDSWARDVPFDTWVVDTHKRCVSVGYTLIDAFSMVEVLDKILTSCIGGVVIVLWLLLTHLLTTQVLILIASQIVALAFVFGDTCRTFFQGFIFAFITHPYYIGDICIINDIEVEVKRINVMTTTCLRTGTNDHMIYPNSTLATTLIINLGDNVKRTKPASTTNPSSTETKILPSTKTETPPTARPGTSSLKNM